MLSDQQSIAELTEEERRLRERAAIAGLVNARNKVEPGTPGAIDGADVLTVPLEMGDVDFSTAQTLLQDERWQRR